MNQTFSIALTLGALLLAAPAWGTDERPVDERRPLKADARVSVKNVAGLNQVEAWDKNELHLTGELAPEVEKLEITGNESSLRIVVRVPKHTRNVTQTRLSLRVPAGISLEAEGVSADVTVKGLRGPVEVESVSGDVRLDVASTRVKAESVSGDVTVQAPASDVRAASVSGDVTLRGVRGEVRGESVSGDVRVFAGAELRKLDLESVSGDLEIEIEAELAADCDVSAETLSGSIVLAVPRLPGGDVEMQTFSGDLSSAWSPAPGRGAREFRHEGGGKGRVKLHSFSGDVELKKK